MTITYKKHIHKNSTRQQIYIIRPDTATYTEKRYFFYQYCSNLGKKGRGVGKLDKLLAVF
jgi:hypothetical protein